MTMTNYEFNCLYVFTRYRNGTTVAELVDELNQTERTIRRQLARARALIEFVPWGPNHPDYDEMGQ